MIAKKIGNKVSKTKKESSEKAGGKPARVVLLDSHAILHRAYHALPDFTSGKGEPTGALYGLILMLLKIVDELKPDYVIAARDLPGKTVRHEKFEAYKAHRMKADEALVSQLVKAPEIFEAFGIPVYSCEGYEADDVVGTIVKQLSKRSDIETIIATGDMDTLQLVSDRVKVFTLRKGLSDTVMYTPEKVLERYGFGPEQVVDYKALRGDPSDNIPGVRGIGEKTATELIIEFGTVDALYTELEKGPEHLAKRGVKARIAQLLLDGKANAAFSKELATIHPDAPITFALPERHWQIQEHGETIAKVCDEYEFRSLKARLGLAAHEERVTETTPGAGQYIDPQLLAEVSIALWLLKSDVSDPKLEDILRYARTEDFKAAREHILEELRKTGRLLEVFEQIEKPLMPIVARMNVDGVHLDVDFLKKLAAEYSTELQKLATRIYAHAGHEFNINSPKQLGTVLYDELQIGAGGKLKKTATGARTTREDELQKLSGEHPIIADILDYRELQKLLGTYIEKMPALVGSDGRLHAQFVQAGTTTGRMSSQDPNLQNIPIRTESGRRIREAFSAEKGWKIVAIDYSQIELRIAAGLSGDEKLTEIFKKGEDVHAATAAQVFGVPRDSVDREMRRRAKIINFGILYGMGVNALRQNLGADVSREESARFLDEYFKNFPGLARYMEQTKADAARLGYTETLYGRRRYFPGFASPLPNLRAQAERMAINAPIQGTQADIIKRAMIEADALIEAKGWRQKVRLLLQVHDELVYEIVESDVSEIGEALRSVMENVVDPAQLSGVPIKAEMSVGDSWGSVQKVQRA